MYELPVSWEIECSGCRSITGIKLQEGYPHTVYVLTRCPFCDQGLDGLVVRGWDSGGMEVEIKKPCIK